MKRSICLVWLLAATLVAAAQERARQWDDPALVSENLRSPRSEFVSYTIRDEAEAGNRKAAKYYRELDFVPASDNVFKSTFEASVLWIGRDVYFHSEGSQGAFAFYVNGKYAGYSQDNRTPAEFHITPWLVEGTNELAVVRVDGSGRRLEAGLGVDEREFFENTYVYSQPKVCIEDYVVSSEPDSTDDHGVLDIKVIVGNSFNYEEKVTIGFDIYAPDGKLKEYSLAETAVPGRGRDTVEFRALIYGVMQNLWSARSPKLYKVMLYVKKDGFYTEYIPLRVGFGRTRWDSQGFMRNGQRIQLKAVEICTGSSRSEALKTLRSLRGEGYNALYVRCPQPYWFYDLCDEVGFYVLDRANINPAGDNRDRRVGGTPSNDPRWLGAYLERSERMYCRMRNHTCVVGFSLGDNAGNGYNLYKSYQLLKGLETLRPIVYGQAEGEWNCDIVLPRAEKSINVMSVR